MLGSLFIHFLSISGGINSVRRLVFILERFGGREREAILSDPLDQKKGITLGLELGIHRL